MFIRLFKMVTVEKKERNTSSLLTYQEAWQLFSHPQVCSIKSRALAFPYFSLFYCYSLDIKMQTVSTRSAHIIIIILILFKLLSNSSCW